MPAINKSPQMPQEPQTPIQSKKAPPSPQEAPKEKEATSGLFDFPKDLAMKAVELSQKGVAKNSVEFLDDMKDIKQEGKEFVDHVKEGKVLAAAGDGLSILGNAASGIGNLFSVGVNNIAGGASTLLAAPLNLLDKGAEALGDATEESDNFFAKGANFLSRAVGGENSHESLKEVMVRGTQTGVQEAVKGIKNDDLKWALKLEKKVKSDYQPTQSETDKYTKIMTKMAETQKPISTGKPVSQEDIQWAQQLEVSIKKGHEPSAEEIQRYESVYNRLQAAQTKIEE